MLSKLLAKIFYFVQITFNHIINALIEFKQVFRNPYELYFLYITYISNRANRDCRTLQILACH